MKYSEGTCFLVRLEDDGYAVGVIARASKGGAALLTYHFAPRYETPPTLDLVGIIDPRMPLLVARTGNLHLKTGRWPVLGKIPNWRQSDWPMPAFLRNEPITNRRFAVFYSDEDPGKFIREEPAPPGFNGPVDASWGHGSIESWLTVALTPESDDKGLDDPLVMTPWSKEAFVTNRGRRQAITLLVGPPEKSSGIYSCKVDAGPVLGRSVNITGPNPERARRNAMNLLKVAVHQRKVVDESGLIVEIPTF